MGQADTKSEGIDAVLLTLIKQEREKALSLREWKFRLAGYGYGIKDVHGTQVVTRLPHGTELGVLPAQAI